MTIRKRGTTSTEEALRAALDEMNDLYNQASCAYHSLDADGLFVRANDTELSWLGYTRDEFVGTVHFTDLLTPGGAPAASARRAPPIHRSAVT